jgi:hypothetical protein
MFPRTPLRCLRAFPGVRVPQPEDLCYVVCACYGRFPFHQPPTDVRELSAITEPKDAIKGVGESNQIPRGHN